jgi:hypothetical protein
MAWCTNYHNNISEEAHQGRRVHTAGSHRQRVGQDQTEGWQRSNSNMEVSSGFLPMASNYNISNNRPQQPWRFTKRYHQRTPRNTQTTSSEEQKYRKSLLVPSSGRMCKEHETGIRGEDKQFGVNCIVTNLVSRRALELEEYMADENIPAQRRELKKNHMKRAEAQYLRFLRTKEKTSNFITVQKIGKGAFGEVKLVQRKTDGKIYALKSLVKSEMVC